MLTINTSDISPLELQGYLQSAIAPRPICLASTIDKTGQVNLSPFSYFNLFSMNPPICIFSPSRRVRDNTTKHTLENLKEVPECVINIVNYAMVGQVSLSSCEYSKDVNEFTKAGFTQIPSDLVAPPRVAESPIQLECTVAQIIALGEKAGAGNLVLAEIKRIHIAESVLNANNKIDQAKLDLVARLGGDWYARINEQNLFEVTKPNTQLGMGFDMLPTFIRESEALSNNEKAQLANCTTLPESIAKNTSISIDFTDEHVSTIKKELAGNDAQAAWAIIETLIAHQ
jgi:flavin reductase (DIM6/NTAB) family NADH-FMN oxidoreductase RutF